MTSSTAERETVLITGASRGLGRALAGLYAAAGCRVIACMRQGGDETLDVADPASIAALGKRLEGQPIDIVVNNAAIRGDTGGLGTLETDDFLTVMRINALAPLLVARALRPNLLAEKRKVLVNIGSRAGSPSSRCIPAGCAPIWGARRRPWTWRTAPPASRRGSTKRHWPKAAVSGPMTAER